MDTRNTVYTIKEAEKPRVVQPTFISPKRTREKKLMQELGLTTRKQLRKYRKKQTKIKSVIL